MVKKVKVHGVILEKESDNIYIDEKLEKSCPKGYPWSCNCCTKNIYCSRPK